MGTAASLLLAFSCSMLPSSCMRAISFFFNDTATTDIYTLSLHDALPILRAARAPPDHPGRDGAVPGGLRGGALRAGDRKSTRLNSSHLGISYAVFCLKKKICIITAGELVFCCHVARQHCPTPTCARCLAR